MVREGGGGGGGSFVFKPRAKPESAEMEQLNVHERNAFQAGKKLVAIISDAASTGISLQADRRVQNQRRRLHLTLELAWSADRAVQQLGRTHRANQSSAPLYQLLTTEVGGEARFASAVARRLQALGALTKGDRRAELGSLSEFNLDTAWGKRALKQLLQASYEGTGPAVAALTSGAGAPPISELQPKLQAALELLGAGDAKEREKLEVRRFLNRLLGLPLAEQSTLFDAFSTALAAGIAAAKREGKYDEGISDVSGSSVSLVEEEATLWRDPLTGAETRSAVVQSDRGVSHAAAVARLEEVNAAADADEAQAEAVGLPGTDDDATDDDDDETADEARRRRFRRGGFFRSRFVMPGSGKKAYLLALPKLHNDSYAILVRPNTGQSPFDEEWGELHRKYERVTPEAAEAGWTERYEETAHDKAGGRLCTIQLLTGSTLPLLPLLEGLVDKMMGSLSTARDAKIQAVRVQVGERRLVGVRFPQALIQPLRQELLQWQLARARRRRRS